MAITNKKPSRPGGQNRGGQRPGGQRPGGGRPGGGKGGGRALTPEQQLERATAGIT